MRRRFSASPWRSMSRVLMPPPSSSFPSCGRQQGERCRECGRAWPLPCRASTAAQSSTAPWRLDTEDSAFLQQPYPERLLVGVLRAPPAASQPVASLSCFRMLYFFSGVRIKPCYLFPPVSPLLLLAHPHPAPNSSLRSPLEGSATTADATKGVPRGGWRDKRAG